MRRILTISRNDLPTCDMLLEIIVTAQTFLYLVIPFFGRTKLESLLMYVVLLGMMGIVFIGIMINRKAVDSLGFLLFALLTVVLFLAAVWDGGGLSYPVLIAMMNFFVTYTPFFAAGFLSDSKHLYRYVRRLGVVQAVILLAVSVTSKAYAPYYAGGFLIENGELTLGFSNPNVTAVYLFYVFSLNVDSWEKEKNAQTKSLLFIITAALFYLIFKTGCRAFIVLAIFVVITLATSENMKVQKFCLNHTLMLLCIAMPILFLIAFGIAYKNYPSLQVMGQDVFSRMEVFQEIYEAIRNQPIWGSVAEYQFANAHNGYLAILLNIGIIGFVSYILYATYHINLFRKKMKCAKQINLIPYTYVLLVFVYSCVEACGLTGGALFGTNMLVFCFLCNENR